MAIGSWIPRFSLRRPVTVMMGVLACCMIGVIAYFQIPMQLFPSGYSPPYIYIRVAYPNSTPKEVEDQIVRPTEEMFATIKGLERMRSWATSQHGSFWMRFNSWSSMSNIYNQVRDRLERLMPGFPEGADRYYIWKWDPDSSPIYQLGISMKADSKDNYRLLEQNLFLKIRRLPGVSNVNISGIQEPSIRIEVDQKLARSHRIGLYSLIQKLRNDNFTLPSGRLEDGGRIFFVRSYNRIKSLQALRDYPVAPGVKLHEIARVTFGEDPEPRISTIDNKQAIFVDIFKESEANTVQLCARIRALLKTELKGNPQLSHFRSHTLTDQGVMIQNALKQLQEAALWGGVFALLILMIFLRHFRMTLLITMAIPMSLLLTLACLYFMGESLNLLSLMGLMLSVGMVVDNAIVVVENISRMRQNGASAVEAAKEGASEVALAILLATSTTIVVFLPLILMSGSRDFRFYMSKIGYPVSIALCASLLVALIFTPLGASRLLGTEKPRPWPLFERIIVQYRRLLSWVLRHRFDAMFLSLLLFSTCQYPMKNLKRTNQGRPRNTRFRLRFTFPQNYRFQLKKQYLDRVYTLLNQRRKPWSIDNIIIRLSRYSNNGSVEVWLKKENSGMAGNRRELREKLGPILPLAPGVIRRVGWRPLGGSQGNSITLHLYGPDSQSLEVIALRLEKYLKKFKDLKQAEADVGRDILPEIQLQIQRQWSLRYQLPANRVGGNVYYALSGRRLRDLQVKGREIPVHIQIQPEDRKSFHQLQQLPLMGAAGGQPIPLGNITRFKFSKGPRVIGRVNRKTYMRIKIATEQEDLTRLYLQIDQIMRGFPMPRGYSWSKGFEYRSMREADASRQFALILSITFVFLLMGILFESFLLPFSVLLAIPLAFLGVYWTLYLTDTPMDMMVGIGLVMLIGIVVNHAIVLVDRINQLREEGFERTEAILEAGAQRLRPILMTALTTISGLMPMALGGTAMIGISYAPLGRTVIGGLTVSALLSLIIVPLFYSFFEDLRLHVIKLTRRLRTPSKPKEP